MVEGSLPPGARLFVTGGAGFIGSALMRYLIGHTQCRVINIDKLTYAGNLNSLASVQNDPQYHFEHADICDSPRMQALFQRYQPHAVMHLAAESHVDRSIDGPSTFMQTNILGTYTLLEAARHYWQTSGPLTFRFLHVSTDEVFGSLGDTGSFTETTPYAPRSPYAASKASSDHLVRAWHHTYDLPILITNCSNNYGPYQFPEKLIPTVILKALAGEKVPVYGQGNNVRDWLFVDDHVRALWTVVTKGHIGHTYTIGGQCEKTTIEVVRAVCSLLDDLVPSSHLTSYQDLIHYVTDRPGHDYRYATDASKMAKELAWHPCYSFEDGLRKTVLWYLEYESWWQEILDGNCHLERLGLS